MTTIAFPLVPRPNPRRVLVDPLPGTVARDIALVVGAGVFLVGDAIKAALAGVLLPGAWRLTER